MFIELINKLRLSFSKDSNTSIMEFISSLLNQTRMTKTTLNIRDFSYGVLKIDNHQLLMEMFFHNFCMYKNFLLKRPKEALKLYQILAWTDVLMNQSFKYNN